MATQAVTFVYADWVALFPEFSGVSAPQGQAYFNLAGLYCANDTCNPAFPVGILPTLMYLVTSHVAWLNAPRDAQGNPSATGQAPSPIVGRINTATQGSVSVGAELDASGSPSEAFFVQTRYGFQYWQATAQFRNARYSARPTYVAQGVYPFIPPAGWGR